MATAIYARQSVDKKDSISIETQIENCKSCIDTGEDIKIYSDKGYTGSNTDRPDFKRMFDDIKIGKISRVVVYRLDRISRSLVDFVGMMAIFNSYNVEFASKNESFDTSSPMGRAMLGICMIFAELERENIKLRVRDAYDARSKEGFYMGGRVPYGFGLEKSTHKGKKTSKYVQIPEEISDIILIFDLYSNYENSLNDIVKYLVEHNITHKRNSKWASNRISDILKNPCYVKADADVYNFFKAYGVQIHNDVSDFTGSLAGFLYGRRKNGQKFSNLYNQTLVLALHEGVINSDTWLKCQNKLKRNKQIKRSGKSKTSWLSGKLKCGKCGHSLKIVKANTTAGRYFVCGGRSVYHLCEGNKVTLYAQEIEDIVYNQIAQKIKAFKCVKRSDVKNNDKDQNDIKIKLSLTQTKIENLLSKVLTANDVLMNYINEEIVKLDDEKNTLSLMLENAKSASENQASIIDTQNQWQKPTFENKRAVANLLIKQIIVTDYDIKIEWII